MDYISTRDAAHKTLKFPDILLAGLAEDGGLYMPISYPQLSEKDLANFRKLLLEQGYPALAAAVLELFIDTMSAAELQELTKRAYTTEKFSSPEIVPLTSLDEKLKIGHLSEGPTAAFKDMAMQLLGEFFEFELKRRGEELNILGATSGDTGSAAEYAMRGRENIRVFMLTPAGRMTPFQQAQMFGLSDPNIFNIALDGVFDDCQDIVKAVSADADFKAKYSIGAVNSINWARLVAQVIYYIATWIRATQNNDEKVSYSVPTGNFGDIFAGHVARQMGLPIDRLIVATNENDVLDEFFRTGEYRPRSAMDTQATSSPSMDISRASNFERFIFDVLNRDASRISELFGKQVSNGGFSLAEDPSFPEIAQKYGFLSGRSTHANRLETIRECWEKYGVIVDPHTADGIFVARQWAEKISTPIICLETALSVKFSETILEATGENPEIPARFASIMDAPRHVTGLPNDVATVQNFIRTSIEAS
ncbi:threonine synthase [Corynebacterium caspium]|uniref:threonine synthase n=1 Tax=Corynebacterium caspium TaxID=234828 RepID=UPI0003677BBD|nr:threonine synthase [Corynebacterium caspium]WKD59657.1 Threonine synthase [Corynebacterium caspium DSM 44850]